jgi:hypothetical protein
VSADTHLHPYTCASQHQCDSFSVLALLSLHAHKEFAPHTPPSNSRAC